MDKDVRAALDALLAALEAAADREGISVDELNAYFVMEQQVQQAANHCAQSLYWNKKMLCREPGQSANETNFSSVWHERREMSSGTDQNQHH